MTPPVAEKTRSSGQGRTGGRMDPRISARRAAVIRQQGRRRLNLLVGALAVVLVLIGVWFLLHTSLFSARSITVTGDVHETAAQVVAAAGLANHPPLLDVNGGAAVAGIERLPWVASATVHVSWPDGVHIAVTEQTPRMVAAAPGSTWAVLSADGRVLQVAPGTRPPGLLLISVPVAPGAAGSTLSAKDASALKVATTLPPSFSAQVTAVTLEPGGWVQLSMTTPIAVNIGSAAQLTAKYEDVSAVLAGATLHAGDVIDVSVPDAVTVTPG
jgi:cell division septal protein FtsQ